jgi:hypothetical protein
MRAFECTSGTSSKRRYAQCLTDRRRRTGTGLMAAMRFEAGFPKAAYSSCTDGESVTCS